MGEFDLDINDYLTPTEASEKFGVSTRTLKRWEKKGLLENVRRTPGGHRRYTISQLKEVIGDDVEVNHESTYPEQEDEIPF